MTAAEELQRVFDRTFASFDPFRAAFTPQLRAPDRHC